jgi:hypothetical protein
MYFKVSKNLTEHLGPSCETLVFRGKVVGNHWPTHYLDSMQLNKPCVTAPRTPGF